VTLIDADAARERVEEFQRKHRVSYLTLLFTDIIDSTRLKQLLGDRAATALIQQHHTEVRQILGRFAEGEEIETAGDSFFIVFTKPSDAVRFALLVQARLRTLSAYNGHRVLDRIGIHVGEVWVEDRTAGPKRKNLYGIQVDSCSRVASLGGADQILMTRSPFDAAREVLKHEELEGIGDLSWHNHGPYILKGVEEPVEVCEVGETGRAALARPPDSPKARRVVGDDAEPVLGWRPAIDQQVPGTSWILEKKLGEGGFGEVWLGRDKILKSLHVFKFCFRADRVRALKREVTLFRLLQQRVANHPNIVGIEATYFDEPPFYVVMEHVEGSDLPGWCKERGGLGAVPLATRLEIAAQVADALQAAHDSGIIHRDVKPSNILVSGEAVAAHAFLTDFGIGQVVSDEILRGMSALGFSSSFESPSSQSGTHLYMAPELFAGNPASIRSDIYSLGVVLFQLVVADFSLPLTGDWVDSVSDPLLREDIQGCVAGNSEKRFAGAAQLAARLRALPDRRVAQEKENAKLAALERRAYRRGLIKAAAIASVILLVISALLVWALILRREANEAKSRAIAARKAADELINYMQYDLRDTLEKLGFLQMMEGINDRIRGYHEAHPPEAGDLTSRAKADHERSVALDQHGEILIEQGQLPEALKAFRDSLAIRERLAKQDPGNAGWQRSLSVSYNQLGNVLVAQGQLPDALKVYRDSLANFERLVKQDPGNAGWQRDLSISYNYVGEVLFAQGQLPDALKAYRDSLAIRERLAKQDPGNAGWQRDLSVSYEKVGDVLIEQGQLPDALKAYRDSLAIRERLAKQDPGNAGWQRDLFVSYNNIGNVLVAQGQLPDALKAFRDSLAICERLAKQDPGNAGWQRDLSVGYEEVGNVLIAQRQLPDALKAYRDSLAIVERLVKQDPGNADWQLDLSVSYEKVGDVLIAEGQLPDALKAYRDSLAIRERLAKQDPGNAGWQRHLSLSYHNIGNVLIAQGQLPDALKAYRDSLAIREGLAKQDPGNAGWQRDLVVSHMALGDVAEKQGRKADALEHYTKAQQVVIGMIARGALNPADGHWRTELDARIKRNQ
jgi:serine/threonine protein kinase/class 3 adenylate cyclase